MPDYKSRMNARLQRTIRQGDVRAMQHEAARNETVELNTTVDADLLQITIDERIQVRVGGLDQGKVHEYAVVMAEGGVFPPVVLFRDGETLYLADGFHRVAAARRAGKSDILAEIRPGGFDGAVEYAEDANLAHGFALSTRDKRNIFDRRAQRGHEWLSWSDGAIARELGVTRQTISNWRHSLPTSKKLPVSTRLGADGKVRDVSGIQAANEQRAQERARQKPAPRRVVQYDGYDFNQDRGYEEGALDDDELPRSAPEPADSLAVNASPSRRVSVALESLVEITMEVREAVEAMDADQDHFTADELQLVEDAITEALHYLQGYRSRDGQRVAGLLDLLDGLRRFVRGGGA